MVRQQAVDPSGLVKGREACSKGHQAFSTIQAP